MTYDGEPSRLCADLQKLSAGSHYTRLANCVPSLCHRTVEHCPDFPAIRTLNVNPVSAGGAQLGYGLLFASVHDVLCENHNITPLPQLYHFTACYSSLMLSISFAFDDELFRFTMDGPAFKPLFQLPATRASMRPKSQKQKHNPGGCSPPDPLKEAF